ncbi:MAG: fibronectin-binding autotransporter adhesin [Candidatus Promineifilaceae bacterium]|jgi:fibronectin-binding autotransporter adhesin
MIARDFSETLTIIAKTRFYLWLLLAVFVLQGSAHAQTGTWTRTDSGNWSDTNNWLGGIVADGADSAANLDSIDLTENITTHLDAARTIGRLSFGDTDTNSPARWTLDGDLTNKLTFFATSMTTGITASNNVTISAPLNFQGTLYDIHVSPGAKVTLEGDVDTSGVRMEKHDGGVLKITGRYGTSGLRPVSRFYAGTVLFSSNTVFANGISTDFGNVNIVANNATIEGGGSVELGTVNTTTGVFDMDGASLLVSQIGMARGNYGGNQSIVTIRGGASVSASSGIRMGDNQSQGGGATCFVLKSGTVNLGDNTMVIGIHSGENVFHHLAGTVIAPRNTGTPFNGAAGALTLQYRMNVSQNYACLYNLNGGTLTAGSIVSGDGTPNRDVSNAYFNFHGGTLKPVGSETNFFRTTITGAKAPISVPQIVVWSEGAIIDTDGFNMGIHLPLAAPSGMGLYGDTNRSLTVILTEGNGGSGYKATPLIRIGSLISGNTATAVANMADDGTNNDTLKIESFTISNPGMNFSTVPAITIHGGDPVMSAVVPVLSLATNMSGGLTKLGAGTLTLGTTNSYTGNTIVDAGTLALMEASLADEADVHLARDAFISIGFDIEDQVHAMFFDGDPLPPGIYASGALGNAITGSGLGHIRVLTGPVPGLQIILR